MIFQRILLGVLLMSASTIAYGADDPCPDNMLVEVTGTVREMYVNKGGGITIWLIGGVAKCLEKVPYIAVEQPVKPACKVGARLVAKVAIDNGPFDLMAWSDAVSYSCR
jgi:hypothetical protein